MHRGDDLLLIVRDDEGVKILYEEAKHEGPVTKHIFFERDIDKKILNKGLTVTTKYITKLASL